MNTRTFGDQKPSDVTDRTGAPSSPPVGAVSSSPVRDGATPDLLARISGKVVTPRPDCHIWQGATDRGYGRIDINGKTSRVHRVVWEALNGPVPEGKELDHLCRVRMCCNPAHLEVVDHVENMRRAAPFRKRKVKESKPCRRRRLVKGFIGPQPMPADWNKVRGFIGPKRAPNEYRTARPKGLLARFPEKPATHCSRNHEMTGENVLIWSKGGGMYQRRCRACELAKEARRRERRLAA